jgi:putative peptide zinc metalloprotease protein
MDPLHSPSWYHVADLHPCASRQARFVRHTYRGETWFVTRTPVTGQVHRIAPAAHAIVTLMDGESTTQEIWDTVCARLGDDAPTQDETIWILSLLHAAGLLCCDVPPDTTALFDRVRRREERERRSRLNPISFRMPLYDPDAFLNRWQALVDRVFSRMGAVLWCAVVLAGALSALRHGPELAAAGRALLEPESLVALWLAYPIVKGLHELGHAFAVKRWGGEVHEMGILFMVFVPMPYVDATASAIFKSKQRRMVVGGAGILVELFLAAVATLVWAVVEPGLVKHVAYAVMVVGGVSTLLFNGNPLLRFDGYYVLADAIEIPNLADKANRYIAAQTRRLVLGMRNTRLPDTTSGEARWLVGYGIAAFAYRISVMLAIALFLAGQFFVLGIGLALATLFLRIVVPVAKQAAFVLTDPSLGDGRGRALSGALAGLAAGLLLVLVVPLPLTTRSEGVIWLPEHAHVRAGADGFVVEVLAPLHSEVELGDPLIRTRDPTIEARVRVLEADRRELRIRAHALARTNRVQAEVTRAQLAATEAELARARERAGAVLIRSPAAGTFVIAGGKDLVGLRIEQGEVVAYVVDLASTTARVIVTQEDIGLLRERRSRVWVRLAHDLGTVVPAELEREIPAATNQLPSRALGTDGGGRFAVDPMDPEGLQTLEPVFQFDLRLPTTVETLGAGQRVYVRFDHGSEPIGRRAYRSLRRLFLRRLNV